MATPTGTLFMRATRLPRSSPSSSSETKHGNPSRVRTTSTTSTTCSLAIRAAACASRSNRATASGTLLSVSCLTLLFCRIVREVGGQPALGLARRYCLAVRVALDLRAIDFAHGKIPSLGMPEVDAAHAGRRHHRKMLGQGDADLRGIEEGE